MTAKEGGRARVDKGLALCYNGLKRGCGKGARQDRRGCRLASAAVLAFGRRKGARLMPADVLSEIILEVTL